MRAATVLSALAFVAAGAAVLLELRHVPEVRHAPQAADESPARADVVVAAAPAQRPVADARPRVQQAIARARAEVASPRDVEPYLDDLEARARRQHQVTALEVEPGVAAIRAQYPPEEAMARVEQFTDRMARLSARLDGRQLDAERAPGLQQPPAAQ